MTDLSNKVAVVTGAANGLGKAITKELIKEGCKIAALDVDMNGLERLKSELESSKNISIHTVDISREQEIINTRAEILRIYGHVDMLINNAGVSISQPFDQMRIDDFKSLFDINFWGMVYCTKHFLHDLKGSGKGWLVNIISDFAMMGFPGKTAYASSKSAIMGFTNSIKTELAGFAINVSLVIPPALNTALVKNSIHMDETRRKNEMDFLQKNGMDLERAAQKIISGIKAGRFRIIVGQKMFWLDLGVRLFPTRIHNLIGKNKKRFDFI